LNIISKTYNDIEVFFDYSNSLYINATQIAKRFNKQASKWIENKDTQEYIHALSQKQNIANGDLVVIRKGGNDKSITGTWIHKKLITAFSRWLDPYFAVWCDEVIEEILKTGSYSLQKVETEQETKQTSLEIVENGIKLLKKFRELNPLEQIELDTFHKNKNGESLLEQFGKSFKNSYFLPTELGKFSGQSGTEINLILEKKGFQFRDENGVWKPTENGKEFCLEIGNAYNQLKWRLETILNQVQHKH
jgi:frataxin-like iron-binding protein CyaY